MALGLTKALRELSIWAVAVTAGAASFHYFEDAYNAVGTKWPQLAVTGAAPTPDITGSIKSPQGNSGLPKEIPPRLVIDAASWTPVVLQEPAAPRRVALEANSYGHFHVDAEINGRTIELMTDTGATFVALSYETALELGYSPASLKFSGRSNTANGIARVAPVTLESIRVGEIEIRNVAAVVAEPGKMNQNLLGMSFISKLTRFELRGRQLVLIQ